MWPTAEKRYVPHVCLRNPFPLFLVGIPSSHSLPGPWASWEPRTFRHLCINWWHHAHPFLAAAEKDCVMQRSRGSEFVTIQWLCCQLCYVTAANQRTIVEIELLATVSWTIGCQPSAADVRKMWRTAEKRYVPHVCLRHPFPPFLLWNLSLHFLPQAWASWELRTFRHLCIKSWLHHAHPLVAAAEKDCVMQRSRGSEFVTMQWLCCSCAMWLLQTNEQLLRLSF